MKTSTFTWKKIKNDDKMKFCTGINTMVAFDKMFGLIQPFLFDIVFYKGPKTYKKF